MMMEGIGGVTTTLDLPLEGVPLRFRTGQLLRARVLEDDGQETILLLAGRRLRVRTKVPLNRGQDLQLQVQGREQGGAIVLRILGPPTSGIPGADTEQVRRLLDSLGVEINPPTALLAAELSRQGLPVTAHTLTLLGSILGGSEPSPWEAMALVWLWGRSLPLTEAFLEPLLALFRDDDPGGFLDLFPALEAGQGREGEGVRAMLQQLLFSPARDGARALQDLPRLLGLDHEAQWGRYCSTVDLGQDSSDLEVEGDGAAHSAKQTLKPLLLALIQGDSPELTPELQVLLAKITGLQILHAGMWSLHCMGWLHLPGRDPPFFLSVQEEDRGGGTGGDRYWEVVVFTSLPHLGPVVFELHRGGDRLTCIMTVEKDDARQLLEECRQRLLEALQDLPWRVQILPCRLRGTGTVREDWLRRIILPPPTGPQVDIRV